jgi:hypothetical protein
MASQQTMISDHAAIDAASSKAHTIPLGTGRRERGGSQSNTGRWPRPLQCVNFHPPAVSLTGREERLIDEKRQYVKRQCDVVD